MNHIADGIFILDMNAYEIVYMNPCMKTILKVPTDEEKISFETVAREGFNVEDWKQNLQMLLDEQIEEFNDVVYFRAFDHVDIEVHFLATMIDKEKKHIYFVVERTIELIHEVQVSFHELTESLPNGVIIMDIVGVGRDKEIVVTYANSEHYKILGFNSPDDITEANILLKDIIYEEDKDWVLAEIYDNLHKNRDTDIEFRIRTKDTIKWVRLHGRVKESSTGSKLLYSNLKDISFRREINDKLHMERVLLHKITELSEEILFRIDLETNIIYFLGTKAEILNLDVVLENFPESFYEKNVLLEEDIKVFEELIHNFQEGISKPVDLRFMLVDGSVQWFQIVYHFVKNSAREPIVVVGKIVNIQEQKILEEQAKKDLLTKCFNKITTALEVDAILKETEESKRHIFFIIDVDNFKAINDNLGHHFGDLVLCEVSDSIKHCFRKDDIIGRIGGDEFVVFMENCEDDVIIFEKANILNKVMQKTYFGGNQTYSISGSIGIAVYPTDGETYEDLYQAADKALYESKKKGKGCYTCFNEEIDSQNDRVLTELLHIGREGNDLINIHVISTVFNMLYETTDLPLSLKTVLQYLGIHYDVDRCYVFEPCKEKRNLYQNTYEWVRANALQKEPDEILVLEDTVLFDICKFADGEGIFHTNHIDIITNHTASQILSKQEVKSILLVESLKVEEEKFFFGIDDCSAPREWSEGEVRTLFHASRIIFAFLGSYNLQKMTQYKKDIALKQYELLHLLFENVENIGYSIDESYNLIYVNHSLFDEHIGNFLHEKCYKVMRGQENQCADCPLQREDKSGLISYEKFQMQYQIYSEQLKYDIPIFVLKIKE